MPLAAKLLLSFVLCVTSGRVAGADRLLRTVALEGQPIPGAPSGTVYGVPSAPIMNAHGQVAFTGGIVSGLGETGEAVFSEGQGNGMRVVARSGAFQSDDITLVFRDALVLDVYPVFDELRLNDSGEVAFAAWSDAVGNPETQTRGFPFDRSVLVDAGAGGLRTVATSSRPIPGVADDLRFLNVMAWPHRLAFPFERLSLGNDGRVSFLANTREPPAEIEHGSIVTSLWREHAGVGVERLFSERRDLRSEVEPVATDGPIQHFRELVGTPEGAFLVNDCFVGSDLPHVHRILRRQPESGLVEVVREGDRAPGGAETDRFEDLGQVGALAVKSGVFSMLRAVPGSERVAFVGAVSTDIFPLGSGYRGEVAGIWVEQENDELRQVVRGDQPIPGTPAGAILSTGYGGVGIRNLAVNRLGAVVFSSGWMLPFQPQTTRAALWKETDAGSLELLVSEWEQPPGLPSGTVFAAFGRDPYYQYGPTPSTLAINSSGQVAFDAYFTTLGIPTNDYIDGRGLWAQDRSGVLRLVAREGGVIDVDDDPLVEDLRTIARLSQGFSVDPPDSFVFNDDGEMAFWAQFTDGTSGVFVSRVATLPEPVGVTLAVAALLVTPRTRRRA